MKHKKLTQDRVVYFINYVMLAVFLIIVLYPLIYIISCSFSSGDALMSGKVKLFPVEPTLQSYRAVFKYKSIWTGYWNSIVYTLVGTVISMVLTLFAAYPLSRSDFRGKKVFTVIILFTMMFSGGLIPTYLLVKSLHMLNTSRSSECLQCYCSPHLFCKYHSQGAAGSSRDGRMCGFSVFY